jgi:hypothetical protein
MGNWKQCMNIFGAFTFGSLIKTFIPGFVWLAALWLLWQGVESVLPIMPHMPEVPKDQFQNLLVAAIPVAILLGLLSNIVIFMGVNDILVRRPVRRRFTDLFALYDRVVRRVRDDYWNQLGGTDQPLTDTFAAQADAEILVLETIGLENLAYVREQYWYHMEFQLNLLLAIFVALVGLILGLMPAFFGPAWRPALEWAVFDLLILGGMCGVLLYAARKNYQRHVAKMTSLLVAAICGAPASRSAQPLGADV